MARKPPAYSAFTRAMGSLGCTTGVRWVGNLCPEFVKSQCQEQFDSRMLETNKKGRVEDVRTHKLTRARTTEEVHMKLVRFEDINGRETFVNPDRVNHVSDYGSGTTEINFGDKEASVFVAVEVSAVASTLLKATTPMSESQ